MRKLYLASAMAGAMLFATGAFAAKFDDMCAMGLALTKDVHTDCSVSAEVAGKTYCFSNEEAMTMFMKDPEGNLAKAQAYYDKTH
jgi:YHS domain-containing protein